MFAAVYGRKSPWQTEKWTGCPLFSKVSSILTKLYHILILKAMLQPCLQGFLKVGTKQDSKGLLRMGIKKAHLSGQIRDVQRVGQSKHRVVESGKHLGSLALAYLTAILP